MHAMRTLHLRNQATIADFRTISGAHLALALRGHSGNGWPQWTTCPQRALGMSSLRACSNAAPLVEAHCLLVVPSRRIGETIVVLMANCAPLNRGRPSTTTSKRRLSTCLSGRRSISCTLTFTVTRPPASRQTLAAALSRANPRRPKTPATEQAARWWPRESSGRPHHAREWDPSHGALLRSHQSLMRNVQSGPNGVCQEAGSEVLPAWRGQSWQIIHERIVPRSHSTHKVPPLWRVKPHSLEVLPAMTGCFDVCAASSPNEGQHYYICNLRMTLPNHWERVGPTGPVSCSLRSPKPPCLHGRLARSRVSCPPEMFNNCRNTCQMAASCCLANSSDDPE